MNNNYVIYNTFFDDEWTTFVVTLKLLQTLKELGVIDGVIMTEDVQHGIAIYIEDEDADI